MNQQFLDQQITHLYQTGIERGAIKAFCKRFGIGRHIVRRRALALGVAQPMKKDGRWTPEEEALLEVNYHRPVDSIRAIFKRHGYSRTETAISLKRKRMKLFIEGSDIYSAYGLAGVMGVDRGVVIRWIEKGLLRATKKGTKRTPQQGGDIYQITHNAAKEFIRDNVGIVDIRKIDKFWLIDLLTNQIK